MRDMFLNMNQAKMLEISEKFIDGRGRSKIDLTDFVLLRRLGDFILSSKTIAVIKDNQIFHWVHYETIQESLPIVFPTKLAIRKRIDKLKKLGLIINKKHNVKKDDTGVEGFSNAGTYSIIQLSKEVRQLFDEPIKVKVDDGCDPLGNKGCYPVGNKGCYPLGNNKEPQERNPKKETPSLRIDVSLSENQEQELQIELKKELDETRKLNPVSKSVSKAGGSPFFVATVLVPLATKHGKQTIINILKDIKAEQNNTPIKNLEALIMSRI